MIGKKAEAVLNRAVRNAMDNGHEYITLEHVLLSLVEEPSTSEALRACGANIDELKRDIEAYLAKEIPKTVKKAQLTDEDEDEDPEHPVATLSIQRLVQRALFHVQSAGKDEIRPEDLLVALFQAKDSHAFYLLGQQGVERLDLLNYLSHGVKKDSDPSIGGSDSPPDDDEAEVPNRALPGRAPKDTDPLKLYTQNLNTRARDGKIDPLIGRATELERIIQTLCRRRKNNPLLVGEAGVGKTALAEGLALRIIDKQVPDLLAEAVVYALDLGALLAGAKFRGDFEQRLKRVLASLQAKKDRGELPILFIDEIHTIIGAGAVSGGALDAANMLKPLLTQGELRCIGSTTYSEYRNVFEKDHALARRFQKIDVVEPSQEEAIKILDGLRPRFEEHHLVTYSPEAIRSAVELSAKHLMDRHLPDKAIDVIDEAGARARLKRPPEQKHPSKIDQTLIEEIVAQIARIPARSVNSSQKDRLKNLERDLRIAIFGQNDAIGAVVGAIRLARSGLRTGDRPVGSFLFCGPTGVGKTELAKQLAHALGVPFQRYDMSEYGERHTVSRLIGAPPGYIGFDQAGLLTDAIIKNPHAVVLLDEIEKAHPEIWNILLQVMDHGFLTDNNGRKADFRNAILLMTSNVGSRELERSPLGIANEVSSTAARASGEVERTFSPEFRNRLDAIVYFNSLDPMTIAQVVGKQLLELESQLLAKGIDLEVDADVREYLASKGYDRRMGARPMARLIQDQIKRPLSEEILYGKLENGGTLRIRLREGKLHFDIKPPKPDRKGAASAIGSDAEGEEKPHG